ncbi:uncharacterized protein LOC129793798 [Lutzomyia longipalpis]|nr:uncharacterized protein LOC129793798 [Lutzomyia longipalpis]
MLKHMPPGAGQSRAARGNVTSSRPPQPLNVSALSTTGPGPPKILANGGPPRMSSMINTTPLTSVSSTNNLLTNNRDRIGAREALTSLGLLCLVSLLLALLSLIFLLKISPGGRDPLPPPGPTAPEDYAIVYDVTLALCALSLSLNLCCLLVCAIQFLFAVKLVRAPATISGRGNKYLQKSSVSRVCAVGGFFISIPIFLTGIILYTFTQFHSTPAIVTSILIGVGIVFCGGAMVHNVFVWQKEKTICVRQAPLNLNLTLSPPISAITPPMQFLSHNGSHQTPVSNANHIHLNHSNHTPLTHTSQLSQITPLTPVTLNQSHLSSFNHSFLPSYGLRAATATPPTPKVNATAALLGGRDASGSVSPGMPTVNLDLSTVTSANSPHELSTLV